MIAKDDTVYLKHILDAITKIDEYVGRIGSDDFFADTLIQDGVIRQMEIIGEATKNLSDSLRNKHPDVPWAKMAGMRDKLIHGYFGVDIDAVWDTVRKDIPNLKIEISKVLSSITP